MKDLKVAYVLVPFLATVIYLSALCGSFLSVSILFLLGVGFMEVWLVAGALIYLFKKDIKVSLEEGEEI